MAPLFGYISLWLSLIFCFGQLLIPLNNNINNNIRFIKISVLCILIFILISFFSLIYSHIISDFTVLNVFQNSHTTKPLFYKISGVWGNHEGSMLLWIVILSLINYYIFKLYNKENSVFVLRTLQIQSFILIGFLLFIIFTSNPFEKLPYDPIDGLGFNSILQDPALAIHPPMLYLGYVGLSAAFSLSVSALSFKNRPEILWFIYMKPFVLMAWIFLTAGIALGSIWAYYELGWGGWWFWDPVENAALMPWLIATGLLHSLINVEKKQSLKSWVLFLAILSFLLSIIGTFLVRSGILTSVHTFALDPTRGIYILIFICLLGGGSLLLFFLNSRYFFSKKYLIIFSKEGSILINNLFIIIVCASVFFGTLYPLFIEIFTKQRISVGEPYFNSTIIPIIIPGIIIMGIVPYLKWNKIKIMQILKKIYLNIFFTFLLISVFFIIYKQLNLYGFIGIALFSWIISNILGIIIEGIKINISKKKFFIKNTIKLFNSMIISHLGMGLLILGITGSSVWQEEKIQRMKINDKTEINQYQIVFKKIYEVTGENYYAIQGEFNVYNNKKQQVTTLKPENRLYPVTNSNTTEVAIHTNLVRDLYLVLGEGDEKNGWVVRIYYNPLVAWIWIGVLIICSGGFLSLINNVKKLNYK